MAYRWDPQLLRYRDEAGRVVSANRIRNLVERLVDAGKRDLSKLATDYMSGDITLVTWERLSEELIRSFVSGAAAVGVGGWQRMEPNDWAVVGREVEKQMRYFRDFTDKAARGSLSEAQAAAQAAQYASAAWAVHSGMERRVAAQAGYVEERRVLHPRRAATCEDCLEWAQMGWQPVGTLPPIGASRCRANCRCHMQYRR